MRGDKSFAYDLIVPPGRVSSRVALLLRSTEPKPICPSFEKFSPLMSLPRRAVRGLSNLDQVLVDLENGVGGQRWLLQVQ